MHIGPASILTLEWLTLPHDWYNEQVYAKYARELAEAQAELAAAQARAENPIQVVPHAPSATSRIQETDTHML